MGIGRKERAGMIRLAIIALIIYVIWRVIARTRIRVRHMAKSQEAITPGEMVSCAGCGTFVLKNEAMTSNGKAFCSRKCVEGK